MEYPELYDCYIKLRESDVDEIRSKCIIELNEQITKLLDSAKKIISLFKSYDYKCDEKLTARE